MEAASAARACHEIRHASVHACARANSKTAWNAGRRSRPCEAQCREAVAAAWGGNEPASVEVEVEEHSPRAMSKRAACPASCTRDDLRLSLVDRTVGFSFDAETDFGGGRGLGSVVLRGNAREGFWRLAHGGGISNDSPITCGLLPNFVPA